MSPENETAPPPWAALPDVTTLPGGLARPTGALQRALVTLLVALPLHFALRCTYLFSSFPRGPATFQ